MGRKGFTIIESLLFLAVSAFFILVAATLLQGRNRDVQFADATRTFESIVEQVQERVRNGVRDDRVSCRYNGSSYTVVNDGGSSSDGSCIQLGEVIVFGDYNINDPAIRQKLDVYAVFGKRLSRFDIEDCVGSNNPDYVIYCAQPYIYDGVKVFEESIPWSVEVYGGSTGAVVAGSPVVSNILGFIRDPSSERIVPFALKKGVDYTGSDTAQHFNLTIPAPTSRTSAVGSEVVSAYYCYQYDSKTGFYGGLQVGQGKGRGDVTTTYQFSDCSNFAGNR